MEDYIYQIRRYLPIKFADEEANKFLKYLYEAYLENIKNKKYQFAFKAFHMLYMSFIYKVSWLLNDKGHQIKQLLNKTAKDKGDRENRSIMFNTLFDLSQLREKESLECLFLSLKFYQNDLKECKRHVDVRDNCSHASGKIYYFEKEVQFYIEDELKYIAILHNKIKSDLKNILENYLNKKWKLNHIAGDVYNWFILKHFSEKDLELLISIDLPLFRKKSNNEIIVFQKILYLVFVYEAQKHIEIERNIFLDKLTMFMEGLEDDLKVTKDGEEKTIPTQEIIEENLVPIISDLSDEEREKAEIILNLSY